jgi:hypothetical protein
MLAAQAGRDAGRLASERKYLRTRPAETPTPPLPPSPLDFEFGDFYKERWYIA